MGQKEKRVGRKGRYCSRGNGKMIRCRIEEREEGKCGRRRIDTVGDGGSGKGGVGRERDCN